jgi:hypothetical protein
MNRQLEDIFTDLWEESGWVKNDLDVLEAVAHHLDDMRGNNVPRDLFIRIRGGEAWQTPWHVEAYAESRAVGTNHEVEGADAFTLCRLVDRTH